MILLSLAVPALPNASLLTHSCESAKLSRSPCRYLLPSLKAQTTRPSIGHAMFKGDNLFNQYYQAGVENSGKLCHPHAGIRAGFKIKAPPQSPNLVCRLPDHQQLRRIMDHVTCPLIFTQSRLINSSNNMYFQT